MRGPGSIPGRATNVFAVVKGVNTTVSGGRLNRPQHVWETVAISIAGSRPVSAYTHKQNHIDMLQVHLLAITVGISILYAGSVVTSVTASNSNEPPTKPHIAGKIMKVVGITMIVASSLLALLAHNV